MSDMNSMPSPTEPQQLPDLDQCRALVATEMDAVDALIGKRLESDVVLINQLGNYIVASGGKRLRPQLVLLSGRACGGDTDTAVKLAAVIEFIHTATLLHDDVVDASELRRGNETANALWGNEAAVLVGDFLYSRSFEMMTELGSLPIMDILARTTNRIAEGEVMQLMNVREPGISEAQYIEVIKAKTARLFAAATELGAVVGNASQDVRQGLAGYGELVGTAFQIADDVLDYVSDAGTLGKNVGDDLAEGKTTLPLIYAMQQGSEAERALVASAITAADLGQLDDILAIVERTNALELSMRRADRLADEAVAALAPLADSDERLALEAIARHAVRRRY